MSLFLFIKYVVLHQQAEDVSSLEKQLKQLQLSAKTLLEKKEQEEKKIEEKEKQLERMGKGEVIYCNIKSNMTSNVRNVINSLLCSSLCRIER